MRHFARLWILVFLAIGPLAAPDHAGPRFPVRVELGLGYDTNPYLTPPDPYFDQFDEVEIESDVLSGPFLPLRIRGSVKPEDETGFALEYLVRGSLYPVDDTDNANEAFFRFEPGYRWRGGAGRRVRVAVLPLIAYNREIFFDRDTGLANQGTDSADRYKYRALGANVRASWSQRRWELAAELGVENRDYDDAPGTASLDHARLRFRLDGEVALPRDLKFYADYEVSTREYSELRARTVDGDLLSANPDLDYLYHDAQVSLRAYRGDLWSLYLDLGWIVRDDRFVGYNSYEQWTLRIRSIHRWGPWRLRLAPRYYDRKWDRAFIFDNPTNPADDEPNPLKLYENLQLTVEIRRELQGQWTVYGEARLRDRDSADPRFGYNRGRLAAGVIWER